MKIEPNAPVDAMTFLEQVGDEELLRFLRRLPMVAAHANDRPVRMEDLIYELKLWPFVKDAWRRVPAGRGVANRILQLNRVYKLAAEEMEKLTGETRTSDRVIDVPTFLSLYANEGLP